LNVAKSSLKELLADYEDYLRTRGLRQWEEDSIEFIKAQELGKEHDDSRFWVDLVSTRSDETVANIAIILLHQTDYLLYRFMEKVSSRFASEGGFLPYHDKSEPEEIYSKFRVSKKIFKRAVGMLYKRGLIEIEENGIQLKK
jgi:four helix bundle suffix protein